VGTNAAGNPNIHPAVARIVAPGDGSISYGSGTLVHAAGDYGIVMTNWHVVNEATGPISVHFPDGFYSLATVQNVDKDWDLAALAIRRPHATPVPLASEPPRPGEMLTIAGYGSGTYRSASGACTQYVAPGLEFPYEMVEVAVSARQGDSGGPIFNARGELAGVLFGEGHGRTSGSYCGRVRWFLTSVTPRVPAAITQAEQASRAQVTPQSQTATQPLAAIPTRPVNMTQPLGSASLAQNAGQPGTPAGATLANQGSQQFSPTMSASTPLPNSPAIAGQTPIPAEAASLVASTGAGQDPQAIQIGWHDIAGESLADQAKTVLAAIGVLAMILQALRWLSRDEAAA
jgi:S1-C subfamily serine protease